MKKLTIGPRLYLVFALFMVPVAYLIYSLISTQNVAIDSANQEQQGNRYIQVLREAQSALVGVVAKGAVAPEALRKAEADQGAGLDTADEAKKVIASLGKDDDARAALRDLISKIGDTSGLILDPDIDSFYVMDATVVNLPDLIDRTFELSRLVAEIAVKDALTSDDRTAYLIGKGGLQTSASNLASDFTHAYKGSTDGSVKAHLDGFYGKTSALIPRLLAATDDVVLKKTGRTDTAAVLALGRDTLTALHDLNAATAADLDRLLSNRVGGFLTDRWTKLGVTFAMFVLIFAFGGFQVLRGVVRPVEGRRPPFSTLLSGTVNWNWLAPLARKCAACSRSCWRLAPAGLLAQPLHMTEFDAYRAIGKAGGQSIWRGWVSGRRHFSRWDFSISRTRQTFCHLPRYGLGATQRGRIVVRGEYLFGRAHKHRP